MLEKLIVIAIWLGSLSLVVSDGARNAATWKLAFNQIFGANAEGSPLLSSSQIMQSLVFLENSAKDLDSIEEEDKQRVGFWYSKVFGFTAIDENTDDCNAGYLRRMSELYRQQNTANNPNFETLYNTFQKRIIEYCQNHYSDLPGKFNFIIEAKLIKLSIEYTSRKAAHSDVNLVKSLVKPVLRSIDTPKVLSSNEFVSSWSHGPCSEVLSTLQGSDMLPYSDFVEMCLYVPEDLLSVCSDPVRRWIDIVGMCRHINTLAPEIARCIDWEEFLIGDMWKKSYKDIFETVGVISPMQDRTLMQSMIFLYENVDRFSEDDSSNSIVKFWYKTMSEFNVFDCNVEYVRKISMIHRQHNLMNNANYKQVYQTFRKNLVEFCDRLLSIVLPGRLQGHVSDLNLLSFLSSDGPNANPTPYSNPDLADNLANTAIRSMEEGNRGARVVDVWQRSPCRDVINALEKPGLDVYADFVEMSLYEDGKYLRYCSSTNYIWVRVVYICRILDRWVPYLAEDNSYAIMVRKVIRHNFAVNSLSKMMTSPIPDAGSSTNSTLPESIPDVPEERVIGVVSSSVIQDPHID